MQSFSSKSMWYWHSLWCVNLFIFCLWAYHGCNLDFCSLAFILKFIFLFPPLVIAVIFSFFPPLCLIICYWTSLPSDLPSQPQALGNWCELLLLWFPGVCTFFVLDLCSSPLAPLKTLVSGVRNLCFEIAGNCLRYSGVEFGIADIVFLCIEEDWLL